MISEGGKLRKRNKLIRIADISMMILASEINVILTTVTLRMIISNMDNVESMSWLEAKYSNICNSDKA